MGEEVIPGTPERDTTRARVSPTHVPGISLHAQAGPSGEQLHAFPLDSSVHSPTHILETSLHAEAGPSGEQLAVPLRYMLFLVRACSAMCPVCLHRLSFASACSSCLLCVCLLQAPS